MARITVEDCLDHVENRFELVMVSSKRHASSLSVASNQICLGKMTNPPSWHCAKLKRVSSMQAF